jgi:penicillin-binding protein 1A
MFGKNSGRIYRHTIKPRGRSGLRFGGGTGSLSEILSFFMRLYHGHTRFVRLIVFLILAGFIALVVVDFYKVRQLSEYKPNIVTCIYDKNDILISELFRQKREIVPYNKIPKDLTRAFIAMEDNDFYDHFGINPKGMIRAFFVNIAAGRVRQGGSTITQQLAKIVLTSQKRNIFRKMNEVVIALMIDAIYSKEKILELYLNQLYLGHNAWGVETASKMYFKKDVWNLNTAECALLASLPSSPERLSPIKYPERAMRIHRVALARMVNMGYLTRKQAEDAYMSFWPDYLEKLKTMPPTMTAFSERVDHAPWFTEYIRRKLVEKYGEDIVYNKGLLVYTTLDLKKQEVAERVMKAALKKQSIESSELAFKKDDIVIEQVMPVAEMFALLYDINPVSAKTTLFEKKINDYFQENVLEQFDVVNFITGNDPVGSFMDDYRSKYVNEKEFQNVEGALITINHNTGYIEAMVGGSSFITNNQLNRAIQARRQTGSAIKPLLYAAAMETKKVTPATAVLDSPIVYLDREGGDWIPENYDGEYYGLVRLRDALTKSINVISIRLGEKIGIDTVIKYYAKLLHFNDAEKNTRIQRNFSIALGSVEVSPFELARAYGVIARGGTDFIPFAIRRVEDMNKKVLENPEEEVLAQMEQRKQQGYGEILKPETAQVMISMLSSVMSSGTGLGASIGRPAGGKTGTTNNWKDAWFCGFTPDVTTCIWMGYDGLGMSLGIGQSAGLIAAPVWGSYMRQALEGEPVHQFPTYAGLESADVCERSGLKPTSSCKTIISEVFIPGTIPDQDCDICPNGGNIPEGLSRKGPKEDIAKGQKEQVMKRINKGKKKSTVDHIGNDLLE